MLARMQDSLSKRSEKCCCDSCSCLLLFNSTQTWLHWTFPICKTRWRHCYPSWDQMLLELLMVLISMMKSCRPVLVLGMDRCMNDCLRQPLRVQWTKTQLMNRFINTSNPSSNPAYDAIVPLDMKSVLNPLKSKLSAQCTLQNTHDFNGCPLLCMFDFPRIIMHVDYSWLLAPKG